MEKIGFRMNFLLKWLRGLETNCEPLVWSLWVEIDFWIRLPKLRHLLSFPSLKSIIVGLLSISLSMNGWSMPAAFPGFRRKVEGRRHRSCAEDHLLFEGFQSHGGTPGKIIHFSLGFSITNQPSIGVSP